MKWLLLAVVLPTTVVAQPAPQFHDVDPLDRALTNRAYIIFRQHCPGLAAAAPYIASIQVDDMAFILSDEAKQRDWTIAVSVGITMRESQSSRNWQMQNGFLNFELFSLGAGNSPGIASSGTGYRFCTGSDDGFMNTNSLKFLSKWPSDLSTPRRSRGSQ